MQRTRDFMEGLAAPDSEGSRPPVGTGEMEAPLESAISLGANSNSSRVIAAANAGKYKFINATNSGGDYEPTRAQILAAQMAEEFYGTQVTFVQADVMTFKPIVQKLTGNESTASSSHNTQTVPDPAAAVRLVTLDSSSKRKSVTCPAPVATKPRVSPSAVLHKSTTIAFKHPGNRPNRSVQIQSLQLQEASTTGQMHAQWCGGFSPIPSPVSPLTVYNEFENCSTSGDASGSGGQGSVETHGQAPRPEHFDFYDHRGSRSDEDDSAIDGGFTFPRLSLGKEETMLSIPKLLHLFPEAPEHR